MTDNINYQYFETFLNATGIHDNVYQKNNVYCIVQGSIIRGKEEGTFIVLHIIPLFFSLPSTTNTN